MSSPIVIHMHRPYASEEEYLAHERFSIEAKSMLLIDQPALPLDTAVVFDVALDNGQKPIRAEAKVVGYLEPEGDRPGGLRVRFRRFGAATKAFIDRAVNGTPAPVIDGAPSAAVIPPPSVEVAPLSAADTAPASAVEAAPPPAPLSDIRVESTPLAAPLPTSSSLQSGDANENDETSGIHKKTTMPYVAAPANREALLARLRGRRVG
ncbi:MAG TPA: hypothetical protein VER96_08765 [Polyangiaceae bacterium]|nr:hypothetical protein [Polyangiaceae bacterium]